MCDSRNHVPHYAPKLSDEILNLLDSIENKRSAVSDKRKSAQDKEAGFKADSARIELRSQEIKKKILELDENRKAYAPKVERDILANYDRVVSRRDGKALAKIQGSNCEGCNVTVTAQTVNEVRLEEKPIICESCSRILYYEES